MKKGRDEKMTVWEVAYLSSLGTQRHLFFEGAVFCIGSEREIALGFACGKPGGV
jgi:hypothetical protein